MPTIDDLTALIHTREALHAVAEHILAPALHAPTGRIGLRRSPGGFTTPEFPIDRGTRRIAVDIATLVVEDDEGIRTGPLTTLRAAGELAGIGPGAPSDVYLPTTPLNLDARLAIEPAEAARLADWFALADSALETWRAAHIADEPAIVQLWPEHFDIATTFGEINFGGSPGDDTHPLPYLYVGPHDPPEPRVGSFWNEAFGASRSYDDVHDVADALAFFEEGWQRTTHNRSPG